jgi:hypothetical protein
MKNLKYPNLRLAHVSNTRADTNLLVLCLVIIYEIYACYDPTLMVATMGLPGRQDQINYRLIN